MKPQDKVQIEMTNAEAVYLYLLIGKTTGDFAEDLYLNLENQFDEGQIKLDQMPHFTYDDLEHSDAMLGEIMRVFFTPEKTEQQKKVEELEATIAQAQTQLAQLKQQINKGEQ